MSDGQGAHVDSRLLEVLNVNVNVDEEDVAAVPACL